MANVYSICQKNLADGALDLDGHALLKCRAILADVTMVFGEDDTTMTMVMANSDGSPTLVASAEADFLLTGVITAQIAGGVDYSAAKAAFLTVATESAWEWVVIYDATSDANDGVRVPIAAFDIATITPNGSDIDIRWSGTDGVGIYMTSQNV